MTTPTTFGSIRVPIQADGSIVIPADWVTKLDVPAGQVAVVAFQDGDLRVFSIPHGIKTAQDIVRGHIKPGVSHG